MTLLSFPLYSKIHFLLLLGIAATLPFPMILSNSIIGILLLCWLLNGKIIHKVKAAVSNKLALLIISVFLIQAVGMLYTDNFKSGFFQLEKSLSLLILPIIIFSGPKLRPAQFRILFLCFLASCLFAITGSLLWAMHKRVILQSLSQVEINNFYISLASSHGISHVYFGMYVVFSFFITIHLISEWKPVSKWKQILIGFLLLYLFSYSLISTGLMPFISLVAALVVVGPFWSKRNYHLRRTLFILVPIVLIGGIFAYQNASVREKISQRTDFSYQKINNNPYEYSATRMGPLKNSLSLLQNNWFWGLGTGDAHEAMKMWYIENELDLLVNFNSHNQYLGIMLLVGVPGLTVYLTSLLYPLYLSFSNRFFLFSAYIIILLICSLSENILETNKGIVFFAFFYSILGYHLPHRTIN